MDKDYKIWHKIKTYINNHQNRMFFHEQEIWYCGLGLNVGFEQDGKGSKFLRPILILKKFNHMVFWAIPLTKTVKKGKYYHSFHFQEDILSTAILSQIRLIDSKRLKSKIGLVSKKEFNQIKTKLKLLLE